MARASVIIGAALALGLAAAGVRADTRATTRAPVGPTVPPSPHPIQWKLWVGKKAYGISPRGGTAPLPDSSEWRCRYSGAVFEKSSRNLKEETVTLRCSHGSAEFSLSTTCGYPIDPKKPVEDGVMPSEFQHVVLGGRTFVGVSCDVPGYELRTYRKKK
jgi:hypothetical protein